MLEIAVAIFAVGALGGLVLANSVLRGRLAPWSLSLLHAGLGAAGLILVALVVLDPSQSTSTYVSWALLLLAVAALGGFFLASFHLRRKPGPRPVVLIHAGVAVAGFLLLAGGAFHLV